MEETVTQPEQQDDFLDNVADAVMGDSDSFFDNLEESVNGMVADPGTGEPQEKAATHDSKAVEPQQAEQTNPDSVKTESVETNWDSDDNPYKKRYADSSRENTRNQELIRSAKENEQYSAIINVMKKDPGLINHVRGYLEGGGKVDPKKELGIDEDFVFDPDEAFQDPNSKSAQVFQRSVENIVAQKVNASEQKVANAMKADNAARTKRAAARQWMKSNNMSESEFAEMMDKANKHQISYDDINLILNKDKFAKKVASDNKQQVAKQIANVKASSTPAVTAKGGADGPNISEEDRIFDSLLSMEKNSNLFDS